VVRIGSVGSPILSPQQGISRLTRTLSGYLIGASRLSLHRDRFGIKHVVQ
jgi:hypothetical protein